MKKEAETKRCVIYTRKSTVKGLDISYNSLEAQEDICKGFIERRESNGWRHTHTYCDAGLSGKSTERPALQQLLEEARKGGFDYLVVYKMDRLARNQLDFLKLLEELSEQSIEVVSVTENFDCTGPVGRAMRNLLGVFAQMEREIIRERCLERAEAARMKGLYLGSKAPFGYKKEDGRLHVDESRVQVVRKAYRLYAAGMGSKSIAHHLNRGGILRESSCPDKAPPQWTDEAVLKLLKNPVYMGCIAGKLQIYAGQHRGIVSRGLWEAVRMRLEKQAQAMKVRMQRKKEQIYPLRGLIHCAACGSRLHPKSNGVDSKRYYVCRTRSMKGKEACACPWLNATEAEKAIAEIVRSWMTSRTKSGVSEPTRVWATLRAEVERLEYDGENGIIRFRKRHEDCPPAKIANQADIYCQLGIRRDKVPPEPDNMAICLANALRLEELLLSGRFASPAALAKTLHVSRSLIYNRLSLLNALPAEMERILFACKGTPAP